MALAVSFSFSVPQHPAISRALVRFSHVKSTNRRIGEKQFPRTQAVEEAVFANNLSTSIYIIFVG